jgi:hypothetical protein
MVKEQSIHKIFGHLLSDKLAFIQIQQKKNRVTIRKPTGTATCGIWFLKALFIIVFSCSTSDGLIEKSGEWD